MYPEFPRMAQPTDPSPRPAHPLIPVPAPAGQPKAQAVYLTLSRQPAAVPKTKVPHDRTRTARRT
jgi:hypothetical protein